MRNQGTRESLDYWRSSGTSGQMNASTAYFIWFLKMTVKERGFASMSEDVEATIWRLREKIRVAELADAPSRANASFANAREA